MPMILEVGPQLSNGLEATGKEPLELIRKAPKTVLSLELPGLYGLEPLERIAAGLAVHGKRPPPLSHGQIEWGLISEAMDLEPEPFPMLRHPEGVYSPKPSGFEPEEVGDLRALREEVGAVLRHLSGSPDLAQALADIGTKPYALEWFLGRAILLCCDIALTLEFYLYFRWRFPLKAPNLSFSYREAFYWGLGRLKGATLKGGGQVLQIEFLGGYRYEIPLDYLATWELGVPRQEGLKATRVRIVEDGYRIMIQLSGGEEIEATYVAILAGCEPDYEYFGGFTEEAEENVQRGFERWGPFRKEPTLK